MADVQLIDDGNDRVTVSGAAVHITAADVLVDNAVRRGGGEGHRRALVHDEGDALTLNFHRDYTGGLRLNDAHLHLHVEEQEGDSPRLPRDGVSGELRLIRLSGRGQVGHLRGAEVSLWVCAGRPVLRQAPAVWLPIALGEGVAGSSS